MFYRNISLKVFAVCTLYLTACDKEDIIQSTYHEHVMAGGTATVFSSGSDAYTLPLANIDSAHIKKHFDADAAFEQTFVTYPSEQAGGIGPLFIQNSCAACHVRNGRSNPPLSSEDLFSGLLMRLSVSGVGPHGDAIPVDGFGTQLQTKAIFGVQPEGKVEVSYTNKIIEFLDGYTDTLRVPDYIISNTYQSLPSGVLTSPRNAPPVFGLGLLEAISEQDLLALADEQDMDGDGISGRPNYVWDIINQKKVLGRFGWKANSPSLTQQTVEAFLHDMGITSESFLPEEPCLGQANCEQGYGEEPDITTEFAELTAFYAMTLGVPAPRNIENTEIQEGRKLFLNLGCASCHVPSHTTGHHDVGELSNQKIFPYTDLLLHDMGEGLADGRPDFEANGNEWRTPPLWGIGLTHVVNPKATFLHDGRARTLQEAILWHGEEAEAVIDEFKKLSYEERNKLISFLKAL